MQIRYLIPKLKSSTNLKPLPFSTHQPKNTKFSPQTHKRNQIQSKDSTFTSVQVENAQTGESTSDHSEIGVRYAGIERPGNGLREIELGKAGESGGHLPQHVGPSAGAEPLPVIALQIQPPLADQSEHLLILLPLHLPQYHHQLVVSQGVVYGHRW